MYARRHEMAKCVVWTPIPGLSWLCPAFGHVGVTDSTGSTRDFVGSGVINFGHMGFGDPRQKWKINVDDETWDNAIEEAVRQFSHVRYDFLLSNCHFFVATVLDKAHVEPVAPFSGPWVNGATAKVAYALVLHGRSLSVMDVVVIWAPFLLMALLILYIKSI